MKKLINSAFAVFAMTIFIVLFSCKKNKDDGSIPKTSTKGLFGKVLLYDEFGTKVSDFSNITIKGYCIDSSYVIDSVLDTRFDSTFTVLNDENGNFSVPNCHTGLYTFVFSKADYGTNKFVGIDHSSSMSDTVKNVMLSKSPMASVSIDSIRLSKDMKLLYINRTVTLTSPTSQKYSVVTRYFFSNSSSVSNALYSYQWVSGATQGVGGYVSSVKVQKSTDLFTSNGIDITKPIYIRAYIDNIHFYGYKDSIKAKIMVFPNVTAPSNIVSFKIDSL